MIKAGITGGIGSGKSIVCEVFGKLGISIYNADLRAKILMNENSFIKENLISKFGNAVYKDLILDRAYLASIIFNNKEALAFVNSIVHPIVESDSELWFIQHQDEPYIIKEAALFFETGSNKEMNIMITVFSPEDLRIERTMERNKMTLAQVKKRMNNQLPDEDKINKSDYLIINNEKKSVLEQVLNIHQLIISKINNGEIC